MKYVVLFMAVAWVGLEIKTAVAFYINFDDVRMNYFEERKPEGRPSELTSSPFTNAEVDELVEMHNHYRSTVSPRASNMAYISWDPYLEDIAQRWADECLWEHGTPDDVDVYYGQNLWAITEHGQPTPNAIMTSWVDEVYFYDYTTNGCMPGKICGHYTQVIWGETNRIGCGRTFCPRLRGVGTNRWIAVCQYSPGGNVIGRHPYTSGLPCTQCSNGVGQCYQDLCRNCSEHDGPCDCRQMCYNCGTVDKDSCTCRCPQGYFGTDCSQVCENLHPYCGANPGFPDARFCHYSPIIPHICPLMCGVCSPPSEQTSCETKTTTVKMTEVTTTPAPDVNSGDDITDELGDVANDESMTSESESSSNNWNITVID